MFIAICWQHKICLSLNQLSNFPKFYALYSHFPTRIIHLRFLQVSFHRISMVWKREICMNIVPKVLRLDGAAHICDIYKFITSSSGSPPSQSLPCMSRPLPPTLSATTFHYALFPFTCKTDGQQHENFDFLKNLKGEICSSCIVVIVVVVVAFLQTISGEKFHREGWFRGISLT